MAKRRAAQDQVTLRVMQHIGQVRRSAGKLVDLRRALQVGDLRLEEGVDFGNIQLFAAADYAGLIE